MWSELSTIPPDMGKSNAIKRESRKDWLSIRGLPTDPAPRTTLRTTQRTTLNNQPNYFYGEEKHKKPTCSHVHDHNWKQPPFSFHRLSRTSLFHFRPILNRPPASETLLPQWMIGRRRWIFHFLICVKCLPSTLVEKTDSRSAERVPRSADYPTYYSTDYPK